MLVKRLLPDIDPQQLLEDVSSSLGKWTYGLVALLAFLETGAFVGLIAPGETFVVLAGAVAGQGDTSVYPDDRDRLGERLPRRYRQLHPRGEARARLHPRARAEAADHPRALRPGRGVLRPSRRQDDPDRPVHRPGPGARSVHRRQLRDGVPEDGALQRPRDRALGHRLHPARLLRVEEHRRGAQRLRACAARVRDLRRARRRHDPARPLPEGAREPGQGRRRDGGAAGSAEHGRDRAPALAAGPLRRGAADARRSRARADDGARRARRRLVRLHQLRSPGVRLPRPDPG